MKNFQSLIDALSYWEAKARKGIIRTYLSRTVDALKKAQAAKNQKNETAQLVIAFLELSGIAFPPKAIEDVYFLLRKLCYDAIIEMPKEV